MDEKMLGELAAALAKAQAAFPKIARDRTVNIKSDKGAYSYNYAPLDTIIEAVRGPLAANGLAITQLLFEDRLITRLIHTSGAYLESILPIPQGRDIKQFGGEITYRRRYALQALLGVAAEEDDDATPGQSQQRQHRPAPVRQVRGAQPDTASEIAAAVPGAVAVKEPPQQAQVKPANGNGKQPSTERAIPTGDKLARVDIEPAYKFLAALDKFASEVPWYLSEDDDKSADVEAILYDAKALGFDVIKRADWPKLTAMLRTHANVQADLAAQREAAQPDAPAETPVVVDINEEAGL